MNKINLKERLKFEKEIHFLKYTFKKPIKLVKDFFIEVSTNPLVWLSIGFIVLIILLFRNFLKWLLNFIFYNFPVTIDKLTVSIIIISAITFVLSIYLSQEFQEDYRKNKEDKIKKSIDNEGSL